MYIQLQPKVTKYHLHLHLMPEKIILYQHSFCIKRTHCVSVVICNNSTWKFFKVVKTKCCFSYKSVFSCDGTSTHPPVLLIFLNLRLHDRNRTETWKDLIRNSSHFQILHSRACMACPDITLDKTYLEEGFILPAPDGLLLHLCRTTVWKAQETSCHIVAKTFA